VAAFRYSMKPEPETEWFKTGSSLWLTHFVVHQRHVQCTSSKLLTAKDNCLKILLFRTVALSYSADVNVCSVANCVPLLIQQNVDGSNFFNRSWAEFKVGFNDSIGNYWLGNELLSQLTLNGRYKLRFDLQSLNNSNWYYAEYSTFRVLTEADNYTLQVAGYSGNAGRDALLRHSGMMFSTYDRDNDEDSRNCAVTTGGGFWYWHCAYCAVNTARSSTWGFSWIRLPVGKHLKTSRMWLQCQ